MRRETTNTEVVREDTGPILRRINAFNGFALPSAGIGIIGLLVGVMADTHAFFTSYLFAYAFWMSLTIGFMTLTYLHHATRASWSLSILRVIEAGNRTWAVMAIAWVPIALGVALHKVYQWTNLDLVHHSAMLQHKQIYLNPTAWLVRGVIYFTFWAYTMTQLNKSSLLQDKTLDERLGLQRASFGAAFGVIHVLVMTLAVTDLFMSLDPVYYSTIYAVIYMMSGVLAATAVGAIFITGFNRFYPFSTIITPALTRNIGNMLLGFTMFWAYTSLSQFLIQWSANLPEEISFYAQRFIPPFVYIGAAIVIGQFFFPFLALLSGRTIRTYQILRNVATVIIVMRIVDAWWQITPFFRRGFTSADLPALALDAAAWAAIGGVWIATFVYHLKHNPLLAVHDPRLIEAKANSHA